MRGGYRRYEDIVSEHVLAVVAVGGCTRTSTAQRFATPSASTTP